VYVKYRNEEDAAEALKGFAGRWYNGQQVAPEYSPVTEFREARCRQFDERGCDRGPWCNFMHLKYVPPPLKDELLRTQPAVWNAAPAPRGGRGRSRSPDDRGRGGGGGGGGGGRDVRDRDVGRDRDYDRDRDRRVDDRRRERSRSR
jgi:splicing factor U2AF 35 kDa subunit